MNINVSVDFLKEHVLPRFPEESVIHEVVKKSTRYNSTDVDIKVSSITKDDLELLYTISREQKNNSLSSKITAFRSLMANPSTAKISSINALEVGLIEYFKEGTIDGWLYQVDSDGTPHPYLVQHVKFLTGRNNEDTPYVEVKLAANSAKQERGGKQGFYTTTLSLDQSDIQGKTIPQVLEKQGYFHETAELKALYEEHVALFQKYQPQKNQQFWVKGTMFTDWGWRGDRVDMPRAKAVNDEGVLNRKFTDIGDSSFWRDRGVEEKFEEIPFHSYILMFHLDLHKQVWVHAVNMEPYMYNTSLRDKLVLPQDHRDLIDILVEDMDILQNDIIEGKSGGTTILCVGAPGLGKTLSAEVYSEVVQKPLYRVHSGQLGLAPNKVEESLEAILKRAARWGAVLLIDEADVYIRERGNDIEHNAVVAAFLRTLEYFSGLLFMTTNRTNDVDDAILSRCIAVIKYQTPTPDSARRIWAVLSTSLGVELSSDLIEQLVLRFPNASGRDIKELLKLTSRFAKGKNLELSLDTFRQCAQFRGLSSQPTE